MPRFIPLVSCVISSFALFATAGENQEPAKEPAKGEWILLSKDFSAFQKPTDPWKTAGGAHLDPNNKKRLVAEPGDNALISGEVDCASPNLVTRQQWGDVEVSLEFMLRQGSNSGVKLQGVYEIQIRDTCKAKKLTGDECGGVYPRAELAPHYHLIDKGIPPLVNAARAPGEWQTLSIVFRAPRFDAAGKKTANARFEKVTLNDKLIHENVEVAYPTGAVWRDKSLEHPRGPLMLQGDHSQVIFRNVRLRPLP